mmetsp:Transcript_8507/g.15734  ORF Transcript_8507/g.15734 Transcript_8507/m.15734 type:complete len:235 (-) Transcript_8507:330-1034(-)
MMNQNRRKKRKHRKELPKKESQEQGTVDKPSFKLVALRLILLGLVYFFISIIRQGVGDWSPLSLKEQKGLNRQQASQCLVMLEIGAFAGGLTGGIMSDKIFNGRRGPVMAIFSAAITPLIYVAFCVDVQFMGLDQTTITSILYAGIGFCSFAPHVLLGLFARELAPEFQSTAGGFVKAVGQLGGAFAGQPLSYYVEKYGWSLASWLWIICGICSTVCLLPLWNVEAATPSQNKR